MGAASGLRAPTGGGFKARINCDYHWADGAMVWDGCTCTADSDSNCNGFIQYCAEQGENVSGNSSGATCKP